MDFMPVRSGRQNATIARILMINDNMELRLFHRVLLETDGYEILEAISADAARRVLARERVDAIVWDMQMQGNDGRSFLLEIRLRYPQLPIVVNAGKDELHDFRDALGKVAVVPRAFGFPEVESTLSRLVSSAGEQQ